MERSRIFSIGSVLLAVLGLTACIGFRGPEDLRHDLTQTTGARLDREIGVSVGRFGMALARMAHRVSGETDISLRGVRRVEVGVYSVVDPGRGGVPEVRLDGWETLLTVREDGDNVQVLVREDEHDIRGLLIVVAEPDEWVLVRVRGKLGAVIESAMRLALEEAGQPELHEAAVARVEERHNEIPGDRDATGIDLADAG